ncbi:hypothetical protein [Mumia sp. ZJ430]|uniref:hypothetical protein n=1 Tax=Mumia sp. ZJ430 TaxID=2708083 RepID=UPI00141EBEAC|nr:hypothetical protein [Mumia sp. ZJ430]
MSDSATHGLLAALLERVGEAVSDAASTLDGLDDEVVAAGAGEIVAVALCEAVVRIGQGMQADAMTALDRRRREVVGSSMTEHDLCRSLFAEIAMARQASATAGETTYRLARDLEDHPEAHALLRDGEVNQAVVAAVCRETVSLDPSTRAEVDRELAPQLRELGPKRAAAAARRLVLDHEPHAAYERTVRAREERHVHLRPELDAMATLSIYAPAEQLVGGVAPARRRGLRSSQRRRPADDRAACVRSGARGAQRQWRDVGRRRGGRRGRCPDAARDAVRRRRRFGGAAGLWAGPGRAGAGVGDVGALVGTPVLHR